MLRVGQGLSEVFGFLFDEKPGTGNRGLVHHADHGGMLPMDHAKGVADNNISRFGELPAEFRVVVGLPGMKAQVFQQQHIARFEGGNHGFDVRSDTVRSHGHILSQEFAESFRYRSEGKLRFERALGLAHMGAEDADAPVLPDVLDRGQSRLDSAVILDAAFPEGHVQIQAHQHSFILHIDRVKKGHATS